MATKITAKNIIVGFLVIALLTTTSILITNNNVRLQIDASKSTFYIFDGTWKVSGVEYNKLYDETKLISPTKVNVINKINNLTQEVEITRGADYKTKNGNTTILDVYTFKGNIKEKELFPISHKVIIINGIGLKYEYYVNKLVYSGPDIKNVKSPQHFGRNMNVEWQDGYSASSLSKAGILKVDYNIDTNFKTYNVRLFDPTTISACGTISASGSYVLTQDLTSTGSCMIIAGANINLDMAGYKITFATLGGSNVYGIALDAVTGAGNNITNGFIYDGNATSGTGHNGILILKPDTGGSISNMTITTNATSSQAIFTNGPGANNWNVNNVNLLSIGATSSTLRVSSNSNNWNISNSNITCNNAGSSCRAIYTQGARFDINNNNLTSVSTGGSAAIYILTSSIGAGNYSISNNKIRATGTYCIYLLSGQTMETSTISNNNCTSDASGFLVQGVMKTTNITGNNFITQAISIQMTNGGSYPNNTFINNSLTSLGASGFYASTTTDLIGSKFYNNIVNQSSASNMGINMVWNITKTAGTNIIGGANIGGNCWTNKFAIGNCDTAADLNGDGIADSSYTPTSGQTDYLPLVIPHSDTTNPTVSLPTPVNNTVLNGVAALIATATDNVGISHVDFFWNNLTGTLSSNQSNLDPNGNITTNWTSGTGMGFDQINKTTRNPSTPSTATYIKADGILDTNNALAEYDVTTASISSATSITLLSYMASGPFGGVSAKLKIGGTYTALQNFPTGSAAWQSLVFNVTSDPTLFPINQSNLDSISVAFKHNSGGPGTSNTIYSTYLNVSYTGGLSGIDNTLLCSTTTSPYTCNWDTTGFSVGSPGYKIVVFAYDTSNNSANTTNSYTIDRSAPNVVLTQGYPTGQVTAKNGQIVFAYLNASDGSGSSAGMKNASLDLTNLNGTGNVSMLFQSGSTSSGQWSFWNRSINIISSTGTKTAESYAYDNATPTSNLAKGSFFQFVIDNIFPTWSNFVLPSNPIYANNLYTFCYDAVDNLALKTGTFESNMTGVWKNSSQSISGTGTVVCFTETPIAGNWSVRSHTLDDAGNENISTFQNFQVLLQAPNVTFISPTPVNGSFFNVTNNFLMNASIFDSNQINTINYLVNSQNYIFLNTSLTGLYFNFDNVSILGDNEPTNILSGSAVDLSGNDNNAILNPNATFTNNSVYGQALGCNGDNGYATISDNSILSSSNQTIAFWVKYNNPSPPDVEGMITKASTTGFNRAFPDISQNGNSIQYITTNGVDASDTTSISGLNASRWYYLTITKQAIGANDTFNLYLNGVLNKTLNVTYHQVQNSNQIDLCRLTDSSTSNRYFNGTIDELRLTNWVWTADEVNRSYLFNANQFNQTNWYFQTNETLGNGNTTITLTAVNNINQHGSDSRTYQYSNPLSPGVTFSVALPNGLLRFQNVSPDWEFYPSSPQGQTSVVAAINATNTGTAVSIFNIKTTGSLNTGWTLFACNASSSSPKVDSSCLTMSTSYQSIWSGVSVGATKQIWLYGNASFVHSNPGSSIDMSAT